jgi:NADH dehydrogenase
MIIQKRTNISGPAQPHVVIIGGGFAGLRAARRLGNQPVRVTLIDRRNVHLFQPLLYQVATGGLSPGDITSPLRSVVKKYRNVSVLLAEMQDLDPEQRRIRLRDGYIDYDYLIVAAGAENHYFNKNWGQHAPGLKSIEDALEIRRRVLLAFEAAERETNPERRAAWLTFTVIGGGPTGVELAGAIGELARRTLRGEFRSIDLSETRIRLLEGADTILSSYTDNASTSAVRSLEDLGVEVICSAKATKVTSRIVEYEVGGGTHTIHSRTCLWAAGIKPSPLGNLIAKRTGAPTDIAGRIAVDPSLRLPDNSRIFVTGDLAAVRQSGDRMVPGVAPAAMQQGRYAANVILNTIKGRETKPFRYVDKGSMAVIGRHRAVTTVGRFTIGGWPAWLVWSFIHIHFLIEFNNKFLVMTQWAFDYFTRKRGARCISGETSHTSISRALPKRGKKTDHRSAA